MNWKATIAERRGAADDGEKSSSQFDNSFLPWLYEKPTGTRTDLRINDVSGDTFTKRWPRNQRVTRW